MSKRAWTDKINAAHVWEKKGKTNKQSHLGEKNTVSHCGTG